MQGLNEITRNRRGVGLNGAIGLVGPADEVAPRFVQQGKLRREGQSRRKTLAVEPLSLDWLADGLSITGREPRHPGFSGTDSAGRSELISAPARRQWRSFSFLVIA